MAASRLMANSWYLTWVLNFIVLSNMGGCHAAYRMSQTILYNFASRSRPEQFWRTIDSIMQVESGPYLILAKVDVDDEAMTADAKRIQKTPTIFCAWGASSNKIAAINRDIPAVGWDILVNISDDMVLARGFSELVREHCGADTFLHLPDQYASDKLCTLSIIGREYYLRDGYVYNPAYYSLWADNEAQEVAQRRGCYKLINLPGYIQHLHYSNGGAGKDALYRRNDTYQADKVIFEKRKEAGFP